MKDQTWAVKNRKMFCSQEAEERGGGGGERAGPTRQQKREQVLRERRPFGRLGYGSTFHLLLA